MKKTTTVLICALVAYAAQSSFSEIVIDSANRSVHAFLPPFGGVESISGLGAFDKSIDFSAPSLGTAFAAQKSDIQLNGTFLSITGSGHEGATGGGIAVSELLLDFTLTSPAPIVGEASSVHDPGQNLPGPGDLYVRLINLTSSSTVFEAFDYFLSPDAASVTIDQVLPAGSYSLHARVYSGLSNTDATWTIDLRVGPSVPDCGSTAALLGLGGIAMGLIRRQSNRA